MVTKVAGARVEFTKLAGARVEFTKVAGARVAVTKVAGARVEVTKVSGSRVAVTKLAGAKGNSSRSTQWLDPSAEWGATQRPSPCIPCEWHPSRARRFPHGRHRTTAMAAWFQNETPLTHNRPPCRAWATAMPPTPTHASPYILGRMDLRVDRSRSVQWRCRPWNAPSAGRWPLVVEEALRRCTLEISPSKVPPNAPSGESTTAQRVACPTCHQACTELLYSAAPRATWAWCSRDGCHAPDPSRACIASGEARMCLTAWIWWAAWATWAGKNTCGFGVSKYWAINCRFSLESILSFVYNSRWRSNLVFNRTLECSRRRVLNSDM